MNQIVQKVLRLLLQSAPDGLISPSYLFATKGSRAAYHRTLWWRGKHPSLPRAVWCILQAWYWVRWVLFDAWRNIYFGLKEYGDAIVQTQGTTKQDQFLYLLKTTFWWAMPTHELYELGLVCSDRDPLDYVYMTETRGFHWSLNRQFTQSDALGLADKLQTQTRLQDLGVSVPPTYVIPKGRSDKTIKDVLMTNWSKVFCKQNKSNQAIGAFEAGLSFGDVVGRTYDGSSLDGDQTQAAFAKLCEISDVLVQPMLESDKTLLIENSTDSLITLRLVTRQLDDQVVPMAARLELPVWQDENAKHITYVLVPIDVETGLFEMAQNLDFLGPTRKAMIEKQIKSLPHFVPGWDQILQQSVTAHGLFDLWGIAWDWAMSEEGPVLLEGNSGWGLEVLQMRDQGLLQQVD